MSSSSALTLAKDVLQKANTIEVQLGNYIWDARLIDEKPEVRVFDYMGSERLCGVEILIYKEKENK